MNLSRLKWQLAFRAALAVTVCWIGCGRVDSRWLSGATNSVAKPEQPLPQDLQELRQEAEKEKSSSDALVRLANAYLQHDRLRDAADAFRRASQADPQNPDAVLGLWRIQAELTDTSGTLALAQRALQINPLTPNAAAVLQEAAHLLDQALWSRPHEPWILISAAMCQAKMKRWNEAETYTRRAVAAVPDALIPRLMLGNFYLDQDLVDLAAAEFERLALAQPDNALVRDALGRARKAQNRLKQALPEFEAAERLRPDWVAPYLDAADTYLRLQQPDNAVQSFTKALEVSPHSLPATLGLIQAHTAAGEAGPAIALCEKALEQSPNQPMLANNLAFLYAQTGTKLDRALEIIQPLLKAHPNHPIMLDTAGWVYVRAGRAADAILPLQQAIQLSPNNALAHYHLGQALLALGKQPAAAQSFQSALTLGLPSDEKKAAEASLARP